MNDSTTTGSHSVSLSSWESLPSPSSQLVRSTFHLLCPLPTLSISADEAPPDEVHTADIALTTIPVEASEVVTGRAIMSVRTRMARALGMRAVWTGFVLIIVAFGSLDTLSAWMVTYMVEKRGAPSAASRYQLSGLWGGIALGRVVLAYVGRRMGERTFALMLLSSAIGFLGVVWGVQNSTVDACAIVLVGFFIG